MGRSRGTIERNIAYTPLPAQKEFHEATERFKGFSGPIGSGKSQALCQEAIRLSYLNWGRTGLLGAPTYPMLRDSTQTTLLEILETNRIPYEHNKAENTLTLKDCRSRILLRAVEEFERLRGTNLAWFGLDELTYTQEESWQRLAGRLRDPGAHRLCGFAVWTPRGYDWVYRMFVSEKLEGYRLVYAPSFQNHYILEKIPDFYDRLKNTYDERLYRQEVLGEYLSMDGNRVYSAFDESEHVGNVEVDASKPLYWALDFNVDPMSSVVAQIYDGNVRVVDEIVLRRSSTHEACEAFVKKYGRHPGGVVIHGDSSGHTQQTTGTSDYGVVQEYLRENTDVNVRLRAGKANPPVRSRVNLMNRMLRSAAGEIHMVVDGKCKELIKDFIQVCYKSDSAEVDKERDRLRTHTSDALGYLVWDECRPKLQIGERAQPILTL